MLERPQQGDASRGVANHPSLYFTTAQESNHLTKHVTILKGLGVST